MANSKAFKRLMIAALGFGLALPSGASAMNLCDAVFSGSAPSISAVSWRARASYADLRGELAPTSQVREKWISDAKQAMEDYFYQKVDTPEMVFASAEGVVSRVTEVSIAKKGTNTIPLNYTKNPLEQGYHTEKVPTIMVSGLGPSGILRGTLLLPVSGHTGIEKALAWSKTDTYDLALEVDMNIHALRPSGARKATAPPVVLAKEVRSLDVTTFQDVALELTPNQPVYLKYYRQGSGGPAGYMDGRVLEIVWDGK